MPRVDPPGVFLEWLDLEADRSRFDFKEILALKRTNWNPPSSKPAAAGGKFHEPLEPLEKLEHIHA
jgi:hypothetical protein